MKVSKPVLLQAFSFGYEGWGNSTKQLVKCTDCVEKSRGYDRPVFVDTRIRRQVRAKGFLGNAFGDLVGSKRYHWMKGLGNTAILTRQGPAIQIREPRVADDLLDLILRFSESNRRVIFFCSCKFPRYCHRRTVGTLLLRAARRRRVPLGICEWPGSQTGDIDLAVSAEIFQAVLRGRSSIPLGARPGLATVAALPWGSIATLHERDRELHRLVGPARWRSGGWSLPLCPAQAAAFATESEVHRIQRRYRAAEAMEIRRA